MNKNTKPLHGDATTVFEGMMVDHFREKAMMFDARSISGHEGF